MTKPRPAGGTTQEIADAIEQLRYLLHAHYGADCAFIILGRGRILAASNKRHGTIKAHAARKEPRT